MCTAVTYQTKDFYFGRTLDYTLSYGENITITPRNYPFSFRHMGMMRHHYAMIGIAHISENYPLYYEAVNEKGLGIAGLNFVGNAVYQEIHSEKDNIAPFELIPWILGQCACVQEAKKLLCKISLTNTAFCKTLPLAQLHWFLADHTEALTVEAVQDGVKIHTNPVGVLTNNPPFAQQLFHLNNYMHLSPLPPRNLFSERLSLQPYSLGMGALGLPGDASSQSRFVRAAFTKLNAISGDSETESINQFFHILGAAEQSRGCCKDENGQFEITNYTACYNASKGILYYTTYTNHQISGVDLHQEDLEKHDLISYPMMTEEQIKMQN